MPDHAAPPPPPPPGVPVLPPIAPAFFGDTTATATATGGGGTTALRSPLLPPLPAADAGASSRSICDSFLRAGSFLFSVNPDLFSSAIAQLSAQLSLTLVRNNRPPVPVPSSDAAPAPPLGTAAPRSLPLPRPPSPLLQLHIGGTPATATRAPSPQTPQATSQPQGAAGAAGGPRRTAFRKYVLPGNVAECYQCMECNERRPENSFHTDHMHFGKKPKIRWYCPLCNAYFAVTHRSGHIKSRHPSPTPTASGSAAAAAAAHTAPREDTGIAAAQKRAAESVANLAAVAAAAAAAATTTAPSARPHTRHASPTGGPYADPDGAPVEDPFYLIPPLAPAQKRACVAPPEPAATATAAAAAGTAGTDSDSAPGTCAAATRTSSTVSLFRTTSSGSRGDFDGDPAYSVPSPVSCMRLMLPFPQAPPP